MNRSIEQMVMSNLYINKSKKQPEAAPKAKKTDGAARHEDLDTPKSWSVEDPLNESKYEGHLPIIISGE
jgi:hypothetical protein